nr:DUF308 domain-containing protein [Paramuribaculum sp.]
VQGYAVASTIFGWMLVLAGVVQLCVSASSNRPAGWGWWLAGGVIDIFIGFMLVRNVVLSEAVLPYFFAFIFLFWGISAIFGSASGRRRKYWWVELINGILLMGIGFLFIESGWLQDMWMISFITSIAFIYWGFSIAIASYEMRPVKN